MFPNLFKVAWIANMLNRDKESGGLAVSSSGATSAVGGPLIGLHYGATFISGKYGYSRCG